MCGKSADRDSRNAKYCMKCIRKAEKIRAVGHIAVRNAILAGRLPPISTQYCVDCGAFAKCYEHRDYSAPLSVDPTCLSCNRRRGPGKYPNAVA